ncbi:MAG: type III pantothenate kinase [Candidatus Manganitrophus sp.]|nr:type III pantothenate kinase [Candidatus Manganitrophus sp.]WDT70523.1 MAG: type III pantothenate kinase [Candidatus Manganitrophus sp.]WDT82225.1 MAG: type III pantothenate kinase [Candidatus Manganitrophus sp.]
MKPERKQSLLLVIDIGNTNVVFGIFERKKLIGEWRVATHLHKTADEYGILLIDLLLAQKIPLSKVKGAILSSVVPPLTPVFQEMTRKYFSLDPMVVTHSLKTGLQIKYDQPKEIGADRIVNAAAAYHLYGGPVVIVDFGTATTFCVVSETGDYLGGAIAPGLIISADALFSRAAKLPRVELIKPKRIIGRDTVSSMQSGMIFGYVGLVNEIVRRIHREIGTEALVVATGGLSNLIAPECSTIQKVRPALTLEGLMIIYHLN